MGWDEDETLEAENNTIQNGYEMASKFKKKKRNKGNVTSAAEDAESKGASCSSVSSSSCGGKGKSNGHQEMPSKQGSFQTKLGFRSQEQKTRANTSRQRQKNTNLVGGRNEEGWEVASSQRYRASNSQSTANKAKSGLSASEGFKDAQAREAKVDFGGAAQNPARWIDKSRNNMGWDQPYESVNNLQGFKDGNNPDNKGQKNLRVDNWGTRNQGWQRENKLETNESWETLQSDKPEKVLESAHIESSRECVPIHSALAQGSRWGSRVNNSAMGSGKDSVPGPHETAEVSHVRNDALSILLPSEQLHGVSMPNDDRGACQSGSGSEAQSMGSDDDSLASGDDDDSDTSDVSHENQKKNKWFRKFFQSLDALTIEKVNDSERQWHCPACQGGVGAIDWYKGMQPLLSHAKTIRSKRVKLHRKLAQVLEEELNRRGAAGLSAEGMFGKWKGLGDVENNKQIVWPPIVVIQNTLLDQDDNGMWHGMGNKELFEYFKGYKAMKARHAYGPNGHRGMSVLIFEESAMGYLEAEHLHKHFVKEGRGKNDWDRRRVLFHPGGKRVLYGYIATQEDMEIFNKHSKGKMRLKYDMRSCQLMVVEPMKKMNEDNQKLVWYKNKVTKEQEHNKILEETVSIVGRKLRTKESEIKIIRQKATKQHEESTKEMNCLEQSYRQQIQQIYKDITRREHSLEKMQEDFKKERIDIFYQLEVHQAKLLKDKETRKEEQEEAKIREEIARQKTIVESSIKEIEEYERERQELIRAHDSRRREFRIRQLREEVDSEKLFERERFQMLDKFSQKGQEAASSIS